VNIPRSVWYWSVALCGTRLLAFWIINANLSHDAQWQLSYFPLWDADFPVSVAYFTGQLPIPIAEAVIGPIWWFLLPMLVWSLFRGRRGARTK
jgi:hypothetical protein